MLRLLGTWDIDDEASIFRRSECVMSNDKPTWIKCWDFSGGFRWIGKNDGSRNEKQAVAETRLLYLSYTGALLARDGSFVGANWKLLQIGVGWMQ